MCGTGRRARSLDTYLNEKKKKKKKKNRKKRKAAAVYLIADCGSGLLAVAHNNRLYVFDVHTGTLHHTLGPVHGSITSLSTCAHSPGFVVCGTAGVKGAGPIQLWDVRIPNANQPVDQLYGNCKDDLTYPLPIAVIDGSGTASIGVATAFDIYIGDWRNGQHIVIHDDDATVTPVHSSSTSSPPAPSPSPSNSAVRLLTRRYKVTKVSGRNGKEYHHNRNTVGKLVHMGRVSHLMYDQGVLVSVHGGQVFTAGYREDTYDYFRPLVLFMWTRRAWQEAKVPSPTVIALKVPEDKIQFFSKYPGYGVNCDLGIFNPGHGVNCDLDLDRLAALNSSLGVPAKEAQPVAYPACEMLKPIPLTWKGQSSDRCTDLRMAFSGAILCVTIGSDITIYL